MLEHPGVRSVGVATCAVVLALLPQATSAAHPTETAANVASAYSFAQSSLAGGGFENVIAADPHHSGVVLSGSDVAGIDRSTNSGLTWVAAQGGSLDQTNNPIASIVFDPKSPNDVYAATDTGVAESMDDGMSWTPLTTGPTFNGSNSGNPNGTTGPERCVGNLLAVDDSTSPARIYAASFDEGVQVYNAQSNDIYSGNWTTVAAQADFGSDVCLTSLAWGPDKTLYVSTWGGSVGVYTISDLTASTPTVEPVPGAPPVVQELVSLADGDIWGAAYNSGVGEITDTSWDTRLLDDVPGQDYMSIAGYDSGGSDVVIAGSDCLLIPGCAQAAPSILEETTNSGTSWTSLPTSPSQVSTDLLGGSTNPWWHGSYPPALLELEFHGPFLHRHRAREEGRRHLDRGLWRQLATPRRRGADDLLSVGLRDRVDGEPPGRDRSNHSWRSALEPTRLSRRHGLGSVQFRRRFQHAAGHHR